MGLTDKIGIAILCAFVLFSVVRLFAAPLRLAAKVLLNTALGFLALYLLGLTEPVTGFSLGLHIFGQAADRRLFHLSSPPTPQP